MLKYNVPLISVLIVLFIVFVAPVYCGSCRHKRLCLFTCAKIVKSNNETCDDPAFIPWQIAVHKDDMFVSSPRINTKATATLVKVEVGTDFQCRLIPYPNWDYNNDGCDGLFSVTAIQTDCCDRIWVLDGGIAGIDNPFCPPKIYVFDLKTDSLIKVIPIPKKILQCPYHLETMAIEIDDCNCKTPHVYIGDQFGFALYTVKYKCLKKCAKDENIHCWSKMLAKEFWPDSRHAVFTDGVLSQVFMIGLFKITLAYNCKNNDNELYFHALSSVKECRVKTSYLKNFTNCADESGYTKALNHVKTFKGERCTQSSGEVMTRDGVMFQSLCGKQTIACWNPRNPYKWPFVVNTLKDPYFQTPTDMTIAEDGRCLKKNNRGDNLFILSANFLVFAAKGFTFSCNTVNGVLAVVPMSKMMKFGQCWPGL